MITNPLPKLTIHRSACKWGALTFAGFSLLLLALPSCQRSDAARESGGKEEPSVSIPEANQDASFGKKSTAILESIRAGKYGEATRALRSSENTDPKAVAAFAADMKKALENYGDIKSNEYVKTERLGQSLAKSVHIQKFSRHFLVWTFDYYHDGEKWELVHWGYSDRL